MRIFALTVLSLLACGGSAVAADKPNVILILTDDQGYGDFACHGNPILRTPQLDRLHAESIRFTDFHVAPMCSPTRGEIMTGVDAFRNGATAVCDGRSMPRRELATVAQLFKENGYATAHFGKWHLGDNCPFRPQDRGFDLSIHNGAWGIKSLAEYWKNHGTDDKYWRNNELQTFPGYNTDAFFREAMAWMTEQKRPFFAYLATTAAHAPFNVPSKYAKPYGKLDPAVRNFYGMIANIDENVGRLEEFLQQKNLRENTLLVFMTDNGTIIGDKVFNAGMRGHKTSLYDGGHRVPLFVRWPAADLGTPRDIDTLAHCTDILPTLVDLCGLMNPSHAPFDGKSLAPLLRQQPDDGFNDRMLVIQYGTNFKKWQCAILWNKWRLVEGKELYDIASDPGQRNDISSQHPKVVQAMREFYEKWCRDSRPIMEQSNYVKIGDDREPVTWLSSCNWTGSYCDNWGNLATGTCLGHWNVEVETPGEYEISLYMFHPDSHTPLNHSLLNVPARPVAKAKLIVGDRRMVQDTKPADTHATFTVNLKQGDKMNLEGQFLDAQGEPLFGACYTFVKKKGTP